ncbi:ATP-binding protein [Candidatus Saccharibacteria bacterium]|nr:ATP-binding protein [Candidatus Saccharibacteria bacterium]
MKVIERSYLETLKRVMDTPDIKVITGVRRSGKSTLMNLFKEYVAKEVKDANIVHIDYNDINYEYLQEYHALNDYIEAHYLENKSNYIFIDEVQMCKGFEKTINSLHNSKKYDIYITGSNAFLLSSDLATLFTGRVFPIEVFPFSFAEYLDYYGDRVDKYEAFDRYMMNGGLAGSYIYDDMPEKYRYISEVYDTLILRDIQQKYQIQNTPILMKVSDFLLDNISRLTTGRNITNVLNTEKLDTNHKTVGTYINYLCEAYAFYKVKRYDVEGKTYLNTQDKYYLVDHAFKYAKLGTKNINYGSVYENIVAIELFRRGYEVYVGTLRGKEIDFVANKGDEKIYIQVSYDIGDEKTFEREVRPLLEIRDAYPKIIIARTRQGEQQYEGVRILDIGDWLTEK